MDINTRLSELIRTALELHQQGNYKEAELIYKNILNYSPKNFDALQLLGALYAQNGKFIMAIDALEKALKIKSNNPTTYFNHGNSLAAIGRFEEANISYMRAIEISPSHSEYYYNNGVALQEINRNDQAIENYESAIKISPKYAEAHLNCGIALQREGRIEKSIIYYENAIKIRPNWVQAHTNCGNAWMALRQYEEALSCYENAIDIQPNNVEAIARRGDAQNHLGRNDEALLSYALAIEIDPANAEVFSNCGVLMQRMGNTGEAITFFERAIEITSGYPQAHSNRGNALKELNLFEEALSSYDKAIQLNPEYVEAYCNRGNVMLELNRVNEALISYDRAIGIDPDFNEAKWGKAFIFLLQGKYDKGWILYESRWNRESMQRYKTRFDQPVWKGDKDIHGKSILLYAEQGLGDTIQFFRYTKLVKALGAKVIIEVPKALLELLRENEYFDFIIEKGKPLPFFDFHCALMSLPLIFNTRLNTIPGAGKYLFSNLQKSKLWSDRLGTKTKPRVGLVWSTSTVNESSIYRNIKLEDLISNLPDCYEYICLQREVIEKEEEILKNSKIRNFTQNINDFSDTAALCEMMDIVLSIDTSVAHLAGALGKLTWVLLPFAPDWRWLLERRDSPWYNSMRLYRQEAPMQWQMVLDRVKIDLVEVVENLKNSDVNKK